MLASIEWRRCNKTGAPLTDLTSSRALNQVECESKQETFTKVKEILSKEPTLKSPDLEKEFTLQSDASDIGIGACLLQQHEIKYPVLFASKELLG